MLLAGICILGIGCGIAIRSALVRAHQRTHFLPVRWQKPSWFARAWHAWLGAVLAVACLVWGSGLLLVAFASAAR